MDNRRK